MSRIVIVGGGIIGLSTAYALKQRGVDVVVLERRRPDDTATLTSTGNAGMIVPSHFVPLAAPGMVWKGLKMSLRRGSPFGFRFGTDLSLYGWMARFALRANRKHVERTKFLLRDLNLRSKEIYAHWETTLGPLGYTPRGLAVLCSKAETLHEELELADHAESLGLRIKRFDAQSLDVYDPATPIRAVGGVIFEDDAWITPSAVLSALRGQVEVITATNVKGFVKDQGGKIRAVETTSGPIEGDTWVLAGGVETRDLLQMATGKKLPLVAGHGYGTTIPDSPLAPRRCALLADHRVAITPMQTGLRVTGTMILGGKVGTVDPQRYEGIKRGVFDVFPSAPPTLFDNTQIWQGSRPCSPDGLPYLGKVADDLYLSSGHGMMGLSLGPISGQLMAELISGEKPSLDLSLLDPLRYV
ncbi:MAG: FAD-dependent oxidoreductase [Armatimonadetes bacterium]|nr:FAD-dependent oxidoreductase [Armatimonadota bacterium]